MACARPRVDRRAVTGQPVTEPNCTGYDSHMEKRCAECGTVKSIDDFYVHPRGLHGRRQRCKPCFNERHRRLQSILHPVPSRPTKSAKFWMHVDSSTDGCWPWTGSVDRAGYGRIRIQGRRYVATRLGWEVVFGLPLPKMVCHSCDNPTCCRPSHWFAGDAKTNSDDARRKNRWNPTVIVSLRRDRTVARGSSGAVGQGH